MLQVKFSLFPLVSGGVGTVCTFLSEVFVRAFQTLPRCRTACDRLLWSFFCASIVKPVRSRGRRLIFISWLWWHHFPRALLYYCFSPVLLLNFFASVLGVCRWLQAGPRLARVCGGVIEYSTGWMMGGWMTMAVRYRTEKRQYGRGWTNLSPRTKKAVISSGRDNHCP